MVKLHFAVLLALLSCSFTAIEGKKYFAGNLPPIKVYPVNNIEELQNGGPLNLNQAKLIEGNIKLKNKLISSDIVLNDKNGNNDAHDDNLSQINLGKSLSNDNKDDVVTKQKEDNSNILFAVGSNFSNLAVLVPANLSVLQRSNIHPQHIIGYVPLNTPNGQPVILPAGAVRIISNNDMERQLDQPQLRYAMTKMTNLKNLRMKSSAPIEQLRMNDNNVNDVENDDDPEPEGRGLRKRKRIRRRNAKGRLNRNRRRRNKNNSRRNRRRNNKRRSHRRQNNRNKRRRKVNNKRNSNSKRKDAIVE